ncbi:MAG: mechanosensitive ion channel family protein [Anaerolineaceae bacterium]|nr:mechanosensitive ion channel family protein [Anaerolineaceae bacterium]
MNVALFIQDSLKNIWVVLGLSLFIIIIGWVLGKILAKWITALLNRTPTVNLLVNRLKLPNTDLLNHRIRQFIRLMIMLISIWGAWNTLNSLPEISDFINQTWQSITTFIKLPIIIFIFDLGLIAFETFLLIKVLGWVKLGFIALANTIEAEQGKRLKGFKFQRVQIFTDSQLTSFLVVVSRYARYIVNVILILFYLTGVFSIFPKTRGIVTSVLGSIFTVIEDGWLGFVDYIPSLLNLIVIVLFTYYGIKLIHFIFREIEKGTITFAGFVPEWAMPTYQLVRFVVIALALVVAFPYLPGSASPAFQGISVFVGLLFSLGSTSVVANIVAGIVLTYTRAFRVGDRVKIADTMGDIIEKGLLVTRVRTIKNVEITIPNGMVMGSHIINYSAMAIGKRLILNSTITLGYDISWRTIHETLIKAALETNGILAEPQPFVYQTSLDDFYVSYEINAYTTQPNKMAAIYSDLHQNIQDACNEAGFEILSPHYGALRDGNPSTISADKLPADYQPPSFEVHVREDKS